MGKDAYQQLGNDLKDDARIGIGAVDCTIEASQGLCGQYGVQGYPTIKAIVNGKPKNYQGPREKEPMKQYILGLADKKGSKGGSAKCPKGLFKSGMKDSVVPLCDKHFPEAEKSKNDWAVVFYSKSGLESSGDKDAINKIALSFGNEPADKNKKNKKVMKLVE